MSTNRRILRIDASGRYEGSVSRQLTDRLIDHLVTQNPNAQVITRDLAQSDLPFVNDTMIGGFYIPDEERTPEQRAELAFSNGLVEELRGAGTIVIGVPIYNFGVPASLKAYIDLIVRFGLTVGPSERGLVGLLNGQKAYLVVTTGGTPVDSNADFATPYLRHALGFIGIKEIKVITADGLMSAGQEKIRAAEAQIDVLAGEPVLA